MRGAIPPPPSGACSIRRSAARRVAARNAKPGPCAELAGYEKNRTLSTVSTVASRLNKACSREVSRVEPLRRRIQPRESAPQEARRARAAAPTYPAEKKPDDEDLQDADPVILDMERRPCDRDHDDRGPYRAWGPRPAEEQKSAKQNLLASERQDDGRSRHGHEPSLG